MDERLIDRLKLDLDAMGYGVDVVTTLHGALADGARQRGVFAPARRVLGRRDPSPLATLVAVFLLGETVSADALDAALPKLGSSGALELGLVA